MSKPVITIDENKNAKTAGDLMKKHRRGTLLVTRKNRAVGIVTDSDLIREIVAKNKKASTIKVKQIMTKPLVITKPNEDITEAARKMKLNNIKRLPVIDGGKIVGILSVTDIAKTSPEMLDLLENRLKMRESPTVIREQNTSGICENCGNYSDYLTSVKEQWICETCREEIENER